MSNECQSNLTAVFTSKFIKHFSYPWKNTVDFVLSTQEQELEYSAIEQVMFVSAEHKLSEFVSYYLFNSPHTDINLSAQAWQTRPV